MMSPRLAATTFTKLVILAAVLFLGTAALLSAQAGWKPLKDRGYSFSYPSDWNCIDMGGDDYGGTKGYLKALSPMGETNFVIVIMLFPQFSLDLSSNKLTYEDFIKMVFESALDASDQEGGKIEKTEAALSHGQVPAFMLIKEESEKSFKASLICGDLVNGNAAIIMVTLALSGDDVENGKDYLDKAEQIMASFAFPK